MQKKKKKKKKKENTPFQKIKEWIHLSFLLLG